MRFFSLLKRNIFTGIILFVPFALTLYVLKISWSFCDNILGAYLHDIVHFIGEKSNLSILEDASLPGAGILLLLLLLYVLGAVANSFIGRRLFGIVENAVLRIPLVKDVYGFSKKLMKGFGLSKKGGSDSVVLVEVEKDAYSMGFITGMPAHKVAGEEASYVYIPGSPNPSSGSLLLIPKSKIKPAQIPVEEALKVILSGGMSSKADSESSDRRLGGQCAESE